VPDSSKTFIFAEGNLGVVCSFVSQPIFALFVPFLSSDSIAATVLVVIELYLVSDLLNI